MLKEVRSKRLISSLTASKSGFTILSTNSRVYHSPITSKSVKPLCISDAADKHSPLAAMDVGSKFFYGCFQ